MVSDADNSLDEQSGSGASNVAEFTVSELSFALKRTVEETYGYVRVRGELGRISRPASGHIYLDLKDEKSVLAGVIWRGQAEKIKFNPEEGLEVVATGRLTTYPGQSKYQIVIEALEPAGVGALLAQLEKLKKKLAAEGLFDEDRKLPLPFLPSTVGVVTSPTGAVIRDMLHGFDERFPVHVLLWPVRVQGETSGREVAAAIRGFNALSPGDGLPRPDVLIVGRGGGSLEDLWGFNEEVVARAVAESAIPIISAVGHETDWTLIDLVADARAPTPTKAAEWAVPKFSDLNERLETLARRGAQVTRRSLEERRTRLKALARALPRIQDIMALPRQRCDAASGRLPRALLANTQRHRTRFERSGGRHQPNALRQRARFGRERFTDLNRRGAMALRQSMTQARSRFDARAKLLATLGLEGVLSRGFALVRDETGKGVRQAAALSNGDGVEIQFSDGRLGARIEGGATTPSKPPKRASSTKKRSDGGPQGSLF